jgi:hypothetical protein
MSFMDFQAIRSRSLSLARALGYPPPPAHFPWLDRERVRPEREVIDRSLVLHIIVNCSFGMPTALARAWLDREGLLASLSPGERHYLEEIDQGLAPDAKGHQLQVESLWALAWALSQVPSLDFGHYCGDELAGLLPDLRANEDGESFRSRARLRSPEELYEALDLAYCLSWGVAEANLTRTPVPGKVGQYVIWERRRVLEWLHGGDWDSPPRDT